MADSYTPVSQGPIDPEHLYDRRPQLYAALISTGAVAIMAVGLRLLARFISKVKLWWDDFLVLLSLFSLAGIVYVAVWSIHTGLGSPYTVSNADAVHEILKQIFIAEFLYTIVLALVKFSILAFYWRTFSVRCIQWAIYALLFIVSGWTAAVIITYLTQCQPTNEFWLRTDPKACPVDEKSFIIWSAVPNIATDIGLLVLPIFPIWSLKKNRKQKIALIVVFGLGSVTLFASIARLVAAARADFLPLHVSWTLVDFLMWSILEAATAVVAANLPFLRPIYFFLADRTQKARNSWLSRCSDSRSSRYTISSPRSVRGSSLKTRVRSYSGGSYGVQYDGDVTIIPVEMLGKYEELDEKSMSPTAGIVPQNYELRGLERAVTRPAAQRNYVWQ